MNAGVTELSPTDILPRPVYLIPARQIEVPCIQLQGQRTSLLSPYDSDVSLLMASLYTAWVILNIPLLCPNALQSQRK